MDTSILKVLHVAAAALVVAFWKKDVHVYVYVCMCIYIYVCVQPFLLKCGGANSANGYLCRLLPNYAHSVAVAVAAFLCIAIRQPDLEIDVHLVFNCHSRQLVLI